MFNQVYSMIPSHKIARVLCEIATGKNKVGSKWREREREREREKEREREQQINEVRDRGLDRN
jgi:hypothetical protein